jgi:uncharacterized membrane protein YbjE (DUF340 family)
MMLTNNDYSKMTNEALLAEEKKMQSQKITTSVLIGEVMGIAVYAAAKHKGFILTIILLVVAYLIGYRYSQNGKNIRAEINHFASTKKNKI